MVHFEGFNAQLSVEESYALQLGTLTVPIDELSLPEKLLGLEAQCRNAQTPQAKYLASRRLEVVSEIAGELAAHQWRVLQGDI